MANVSSGIDNLFYFRNKYSNKIIVYTNNSEEAKTVLHIMNSFETDFIVPVRKIHKAIIHLFIALIIKIRED